MNLFQELRRRNVFRVAAAYAVVTWLLLQVVDVVTPILDLPGWIPRAILLVLVIGFPIAVIVAWAFEVTPEGIKREADVDRSKSITTRTGQRLNQVIIAGLLLVIAMLVVERTMFATREAGQPAEIERSVAVLPFADLSEAGDQEWFADGLAEEILNALARTPDLLVSARTSSFAYKNTDKPIQAIAQELGVAHVLEGSVRRSGERLRVTAQLIRADDGFHVWSENYDRDTDDVIAIQEDLAVSIARALETTMDPEALEEMLQAGTRSVAAYEYFLEGLSLDAAARETANFDLNWDAYDAFEKAREIDPGFSDAHALAARTWSNELSISTRGTSDIQLSLSEMMGRFRERIQLAIETAPNPVDRARHEGQLAYVEMRLRDAARLLGSVLPQRPSDFSLLEDLAAVAVYLSDRELLASLAERSWANWDKDPNLALTYIQYPWRIGGYIDNRSQYIDRVMQITRRFPNAGVAYQAHRALLWLGEVEKAASLLPLLEGVVEGREIVMARQACAEGRRSDAELALSQLDREISRYDQAAREWHILMLLGRQDEAYAALKPFETIASPLTLGAYLVYAHFDPGRFPMVMDILEREGVNRPPPVPVPFACPPDEATEKSIAVLPFVNLSSDPEQAYFADGLTEEILNALAQLPELLVTARTSSFFFKDKDVPVDEIAQRLGVAHVLEGSVRRSGENVRITAQLIRAADGFHLWSQNYDATMENVFEVQDDISHRVASALDILLDDEKRSLMERAGVRNPEAYTLFARGFERYLAAHFGEPQIFTLAQARPDFEQATELAPEMWAAYFTSADLQSHILLRQAAGKEISGIDPSLVENAQAEHERLHRLAARYAPNEAARDYVDFSRRVFSEDWRGLGMLNRKLYDHTQACGYDQWSHVLGPPYGDAMDAYGFFQRGTRCNAVDESNWLHSTYAALFSGRAELALSTVEEGREKMPGASDLAYVQAMVLISMKRLEEARALIPGMSGGKSNQIRAAAALAAVQADVEQLAGLREEIESNTDEQSLYHSMQIAAWAGDREAANALAAAVDGRPAGPTALLLGTFFCLCGAPFDIDATPNFKARFEETGLEWPPASPIDFPLKSW